MNSFKIKHIENEAEYEAALDRIDELIDAKEGTARYEELLTISDLVYVYEEKHYPISPPDPIDLLESKLEDGNITEEEIKQLIPNKSVRSLVFARKRRIPLDAMYQMIQKGWVPADSFFLPGYYDLAH